ncbi:MAG: lipid-A-disaccharide synthase [Gammaproteobacteria bacterium]
MPGDTTHSEALRQGGLRVGLVAGEHSGDLLGAGLVREIRRYYPDAEFFGVAGPAMMAEGVQSWAPMDRLSIMGIFEVLKHLPGLLRLRRNLANAFAAMQPDVVIGIDAPDFNIGLEQRLRARGIRTVHYVSPTIWAWRPGRVKGIGKAADLVLCFLPFEPELYAAHDIPALFIGHPMADTIPMQPDRAASRAALGIPPSTSERALIALLPGSRMGEVERLGGEFAAGAALVAARHPGVRFIAPMASASIRERFTAQLAARAPGLAVTLVDGRSREVLAAADLVLLASGTATLETALYKRPMVVAYRISPVTFHVIKGLRLMQTERFALPNLLAGEALVPELIQHAATAERIAHEVGALLNNPGRRDELESRFAELHDTLRQDADRSAARAVLRMLGRLPEPLA